MNRSLTFSFGFGGLGEASILRLNSSGISGVTGVRGISHFGHLPGALVRISGCIVQVYVSAPCTASLENWPGCAAGALLLPVLEVCPPDDFSATSFISHFGHLPGVEDCTSG